MMHIQLSVKKSLPVFFGIAILFFGYACENQTEHPPKPKVIGQKIQMDSTDSAKSGAQKNDALSEISSDQERIAMQKDSDSVISNDMVSSENNLILEVETTSGVPELYNPENKIDPFMPLFREGPREQIEMSRKVEREKRIPRTPLERIDLSQLKLVGIIQSPSGNKGLVEESSGKGYIISMGTYMGTNGGRVVEISKDRVIVEEEVDDVLGKLTLQKREFKLQKPFGEN
jgi:type IV pilus assembly protein PilP